MTEEVKTGLLIDHPDLEFLPLPPQPPPMTTNGTAPLPKNLLDDSDENEDEDDPFNLKSNRRATAVSNGAIVETATLIQIDGVIESDWDILKKEAAVVAGGLKSLKTPLKKAKFALNFESPAVNNDSGVLSPTILNLESSFNSEDNFIKELEASLPKLPSKDDDDDDVDCDGENKENKISKPLGGNLPNKVALSSSLNLKKPPVRLIKRNSLIKGPPPSVPLSYPPKKPPPNSKYSSSFSSESKVNKGVPAIKSNVNTKALSDRTPVKLNSRFSTTPSKVSTTTTCKSISVNAPPPPPPPKKFNNTPAKVNTGKFSATTAKVNTGRFSTTPAKGKLSATPNKVITLTNLSTTSGKITTVNKLSTIQAKVNTGNTSGRPKGAVQAKVDTGNKVSINTAQVRSTVTTTTPSKVSALNTWTVKTPKAMGTPSKVSGKMSLKQTPSKVSSIGKMSLMQTPSKIKLSFKMEVTPSKVTMKTKSKLTIPSKRSLLPSKPNLSSSVNSCKPVYKKPLGSSVSGTPMRPLGSVNGSLMSSRESLLSPVVASTPAAQGKIVKRASALPSPIVKKN